MRRNTQRTKTINNKIKQANNNKKIDKGKYNNITQNVQKTTTKEHVIMKIVTSINEVLKQL